MLRSRAIGVISLGARANAPTALRGSIFARAFSVSPSELRKTPLYDLHVENKAKMVPFAGWSMPLVYSEGSQGLTHTESHRWVREKAGLFDVSHMVQTRFSGSDATKFLEHLTPSSLTSLPPYSSTLSVLLDEEGVILDDMMITKLDSDHEYYVVTNAGRRDRDLHWFQRWLAENKGGQIQMKVLENWGLLALQGPSAAEVLQPFCPGYDLKRLTFGKAASIDLTGEGANLPGTHVSRGGYTGEDGFEISLPSNHTASFTSLLLKNSNVRLIGLGARDSLRVEAGMCLYGNELDEEKKISVVEAGLSWVVGKDRRQNATFLGAKRVESDLANGVSHKWVGLVVDGVPARQGSSVWDPETETQIGFITSGIPSPTLGKNIAMAYVQTAPSSLGKVLSKKGAKVLVDVRGKMRSAEVVGVPFVKNRYYRG